MSSISTKFVDIDDLDNCLLLLILFSVRCVLNGWHCCMLNNTRTETVYAHIDTYRDNASQRVFLSKERVNRMSIVQLPSRR